MIRRNNGRPRPKESPSKTLTSVDSEFDGESEKVI